MFRSVALTLSLLLAACSPAVDCIDDTAFTATVTTTGSAQNSLEVKPERGRVLRVSASEETRIMSDSGEVLALADLIAGTQVYIRGALNGSEVIAQEVRVLDR